MLLDAARKYCFIPPKKPLIFLRVLLNLETTRGKVYIGKDIPSPSSHTTDPHLQTTSTLIQKTDSTDLQGTEYFSITCPGCCDSQSSPATSISPKTFRRALSLGPIRLLLFFQRADYGAVFNYANASRGFDSGQRLCINLSIHKCTWDPAVLVMSLCLMLFSLHL